MFHAILLAATLSATPTSAELPQTAISQCLSTMDGAVYHGDPSDRPQMQSNVRICEAGIAEIDAMHVLTAKQGPQKLFIAGRVLERAATLSFMGLGDRATALHEVATANLYFRVASGLSDQTPMYHEAALANVALTRIQLHTLRMEQTLASEAHAGRRMVTAYETRRFKTSVPHTRQGSPAAY